MPTTPQSIADHTSAAFLFAAQGREGRLSIGGETVDALLVSEPVKAGTRTAGRMMTMETREVGILQQHLPTVPEPGDAASLDGWACQVSDEGVTYVPGGYVIQLQTASA